MKNLIKKYKDDIIFAASILIVGGLLILFANTIDTPREPHIVEATATPLPASTIIPTEEPTPEPTLEPTPEPINLGYLKYEPAEYIAKTVYGEARGCSTVEQAAVIWCILNRVDSESSYYPDDIIGVVTQRGQFDGYKSYHPVTDDIYNLTIDVLTRWQREKAGETEVGRVLPKEYLFFRGDGRRNHFRDSYSGGNVWDWRLENPYV